MAIYPRKIWLIYYTQDWFKCVPSDTTGVSSTALEELIEQSPKGWTARQRGSTATECRISRCGGSEFKFLRGAIIIKRARVVMTHAWQHRLTYTTGRKLVLLLRRKSIQYRSEEPDVSDHNVNLSSVPRPMMADRHLPGRETLPSRGKGLDVFILHIPILSSFLFVTLQLRDNSVRFGVRFVGHESWGSQILLRRVII